MENLLITSGIIAALLLLYSVFVFFIARLTRDNSVMDIAYGPAFLVAAAGTAYLTSVTELLPTIIIGCIAAWSIRLGSRIFRKNFGKPEDPRYAKWRQAWLAKGEVYFLVRSYLQVNLLQIIIIFAICAPAIWALSYPTMYNQWFVLVGFIVFTFGLAYETIADIQLDRFIARKQNSSETAILMTTGLFSLSRRPNYFGETLIWWGLTIMVFPLPFGWLAIISPLLITYIVTRITGPMLETAFLERYPVEYQHYIDTTSYFVPWFKKK